MSLCVAILAACGGGGSTAAGSLPSGDGGAAVEPGPSTVVVGDAGSPEAGTAASEAIGGHVLLYLQAGRALPTVFFNVGFHRDEGTRCSSRVVGSGCVISTCGDGTAPTPTNAGVVSISSAAPRFAARATPGADDAYTISADPSPSDMFLGGEPIVFHAEGGKIPGFDRTLALPLVLLLDAPAIDSQGVIVPDPTRDLALRWTRGAPDVSVFVQAQGKDATVTCQIDSTLGEATLPAEVMALTRGAYWSFFSMRSAYVDLDGVRTLLGLATDVYDATKTKRVTLATVP